MAHSHQQQQQQPMTNYDHEAELEKKSKQVDIFVAEYKLAERIWSFEDGTPIERQYEAEVGRYMLARERKFQVKPDYLRAHGGLINEEMRGYMVDWLVQTQLRYAFKDETLFIAVKLTDRFLSRVAIESRSLQLVAVSALLIAIKVEESFRPSVDAFENMCGYAFSKRHILAMEKLMLKELKFEVSVPTAIYFLEKYAVEVELHKTVLCMAKYLCFLTLLDATPYLAYLPSEIALVALVLSVATFEEEKEVGLVNRAKLELLLEHSVDYDTSLEKEQAEQAEDEGIGGFNEEEYDGDDDEHDGAEDVLKRWTAGNVVLLLTERATLMASIAKLHQWPPRYGRNAIQTKFARLRVYGVSKIDLVKFAFRHF